MSSTLFHSTRKTRGDRTGALKAGTLWAFQNLHSVDIRKNIDISIGGEPFETPKNFQKSLTVPKKNRKEDTSASSGFVGYASKKKPTKKQSKPCP